MSNNIEENKIILTPNGIKVLEYLQSATQVGEPVVGKDLADTLNLKGVYFVLNSLKIKDLIQEVAPTERSFVNIKGVSQLKEYKTYSLTQKGKDFPISPNKQQ